MQLIRSRLAFLWATAVFLFFSSTAIAQREYFVYLQTDNQKPFYVILNKKNYSSSAVGYLILSKLTDGVYPVKIGFAGDGKALDFDIVVKTGDQGFLIKDFDEKGWGLFNMQTLAVQNAGAEKKKRDDALAVEMEKNRQIQEKMQADSLANLAIELAQKKAADSIRVVQVQMLQKKAEDSLLAEKNAAALKQRIDSINAISVQNNNSSKTIPDSLSSKTVVTKSEESTKTDTEKLVANTNDSKKNTMKVIAVIPMITGFSDTLIVTDVKPDSFKIVKIVPTKIGELNTDSGTTLIYKDGYDTLKLLLPAPPTNNIKATPTQNDTIKTTVEIPSALAAENLKKANAAPPQFLEMEMGSDSTSKWIETKKDSVILKPEIEKKGSEIEIIPGDKNKKTVGLTSNNPYTKIIVPTASDTSAVANNSNCKTLADDKDFFALRKKMTTIENDVDAMISSAKKEFKSKCYTSIQIKNLCVLFLNDADKYAFLDAAYPYVQDPGNYITLSNLLTESYYINRFKAMLK